MSLNIFQSKKTEAEFRLKEIYREVEKAALKVSADEITITLIKTESDLINDYIRELRKNLKSDAVAKAINMGVSEDVVEFVWARALRNSGLPKTEFCRRETVDADSYINNEPKNNRRAAARAKAEREKLSKTRNVKVATAGVVTAAFIVTTLIVPSFSGVGGIIKGAEIIVAGASGIGAVLDQKKIGEINISSYKSKFESSYTDNSKLISDICNKQCKLNTSYILEWIDRVENSFEVACKEELS